MTMSRQYHYLVAGLPDIFFDDSKLSVSLSEFKQILIDHLHESDFEIIKLFFYRYDNKNILARLKNAESSFDANGNLTSEELENIFDLAKDGSLDASSGVPAYIGKFIEAYKLETPLFEGKSWELQLSELYYSYVRSHQNEFIAKWFGFESDLQNVLTASQCRSYDVPVENQLIGSGELTDKLSRSNARDFGIDSDFPMLDQILKAIDEDDLKEFEKKIDRIKWDYLDEEVFFHYFTIEKVFSFIVKLSIVERWMSLDKETGQELFNELIKNMEASYEFPEDFTLKK